MSKGNPKAQEMTGSISTESILITGESNWIQTLLRRDASFVKREARERAGCFGLSGLFG